uniref:Bacteriophage T4 Gp59 helicase assembly protein N-terminal domain-containing protein n=1 Tax=viral metagenome TaxID=1070528 RepID=A0A6C0JY45_9ZZZZ
MLSSFNVYQLYHAINLHFTSSKYDFFTYNGKTNATMASFEKRKDRYWYQKLGKKILDENELILFLAANFIENGKIWIGNLLTEESFDCYLKHKAVLESIEYRFEQDCNVIFGEIENPIQVFKVDNGYPILLKLLLRNEINIESVCLILRFINFISCWNKSLTDDIRWQLMRNKIIKYEPFIAAKEDRIKRIFLSHIKS